ncbi:MAG: SIR2 family protein [Bacteroidota bacterium]
MKNEPCLLIGNGINDITPGKSWEDVLDDIIKFCALRDISKKQKPFPILYDEIFLRAVQARQWDEFEVKSYIASSVSEITPNEIHARIREMEFRHVLTTNYDYTLQGERPRINEGLVFERLYSVFRNHDLGNTKYWHIHGEANYPASINLGYEHYCGQLQNMRNYAVTGTYYKSEEIVKASLISRLKAGKAPNFQSWIDLFFTTDIHIVGLTLDFVETDLWWLLTYRARNKFYKKKSKSKKPDLLKISNQITYHIPKRFADLAPHKLQVLQANDVRINIVPDLEGIAYYHKVLDGISLAL